MKCNQCGNENRNDSDFCVYCGARLIPESKRKHKRKNNGGHKAGMFAARGAIAVILLLCGIAVGVYIGKKMAVNDSGEERLYGRRIQWAMDGRSLPFSKANVPLASNAFEQGPRDMWSPEWVDLTENNICFVDGRIFSYDFNEISVYDEDMKLIRQLSDYKIIEAYTDGSKVYMITMANADESFNDQFACWDVDRDELVFIQMISRHGQVYHRLAWQVQMMRAFSIRPQSMAAGRPGGLCTALIRKECWIWAYLQALWSMWAATSI